MLDVTEGIHLGMSWQRPTSSRQLPVPRFSPLRSAPLLRIVGARASMPSLLRVPGDEAPPGHPPLFSVFGVLPPARRSAAAALSHVLGGGPGGPPSQCSRAASASLGGSATLRSEASRSPERAAPTPLRRGSARPNDPRLRGLGAPRAGFGGAAPLARGWGPSLESRNASNIPLLFRGTIGLFPAGQVFRAAEIRFR